MRKRARLRTIVFVCVAASLAFGCFDFGALEGGSDCIDCEAGAGAPGPGFTIAVTPTLTIQQGASTTIEVTITRTGGFTGAVSFIVSGLPANASANALVIASDAASGELALTIEPSAAQSLSHLSIYGVGVEQPNISANTAMDLVVRGLPGSLDTLFGVSGFATPNDGFPPLAMALDDRGRILILGGSGSVVYGFPEGGLEAKLTMLRLLPDGAVDTTFGDKGLVNEDFGHLDTQGFAFDGLFPLDSGSIVTAGYVAQSAVLSRFASNGAVDPTFAPDGGIGLVSQNAGGVPTAFTMDPSGRLVGAGAGPSSNLYVERRMPNGALDPTFGTSGATTAVFGTSVAADAHPRVQPNGGILMALESNDPVSTYDRFMGLVHLTDGGLLDPTFADAGYDGPTPSPTFYSTSDVALQSDGKFLVLGATSFFSNPTSYLARYLPDGTLDPAFATAGLVKFPNGKDDSDGTGIGIGNLVNANALVLQSDGKIVVAGNSNSQLVLLRFTPDGKLDPTFGNGGGTGTTYGISSYPRAVAIEPDGRIMVVGTAQTDGGTELLVECFWP